jgi:protein-L-isoaspartate(D-aspartate) O-methyltransferase
MTDFSTLRQRMVDNQIRTSEVTDRAVLDAFLSMPREIFVEAGARPFAYGDVEVRMSPASARRMTDPVRQARLIQALPRGGNIRAMVVACGSGYSAAILARLVGSVVAIEEDRALAALARGNLAACGAQNVTVFEAGLADGHPQGAPYGAILVDGAVEVMPASLLSQLAPGGALVTVERNGAVSRAVLYERVGDETTKWPLLDAWAPILPGFERRPTFAF